MIESSVGTCFRTYLTHLTGKPHRTDASEACHLVHTLPSIHTGVALTVIDVRCTSPACEAGPTCTMEVIHLKRKAFYCVINKLNSGQDKSRSTILQIRN